MANDLRQWYDDHQADYAAVTDRLAACRNVMLHGRHEAAQRMLERGCVNAVLSIQTERERHERAFTAYYAADVSLETACGMTVYGNQKADWLHTSLGKRGLFGTAVDKLRSDGASAAHAYLVGEFKGLSYVKAAFALSMCGVWELACPDTRTKQMLDIDGRIKTPAQFSDALQQIDESLDIDAPLFIKQWVLYDMKGGEHARHMPFFVEVLPGLTA